jgi:predicted nucleic acid-binding protein
MIHAPVFVDTSAFIGFFVADDQNHEEARLTFDELQGGRRTLLTSTDVLDEVVTFLRRRAGYRPSVEAGEAILDPASFRLVEVDESLRGAAWGIFKASAWPGLSLTDCSSSAIMKDRRIGVAFTFDDDFRRLGHRTLPGPRSLLRPRR